ncbi:MAG: pitrilysin family protein [Candidatus Margulisiibacteriota bacterium]|jgi:predicted Zn-dependent peptidase
MVIIETLPNGVTLLLENIPTLRSVAVGITVKAGSAKESITENGLAHFLEHLAFKGTEKRTALDISAEIDAIGGRLNAHTGKEFTTYYAVVLDEHINIAVDLLADIFLRSKYLPADIDTERTVIKEEIKMYEDTPDDQIHDLFLQDFWPNHALGRPILGTRKNVNSFDRSAVLRYQQKHYTPGQTIISVAGNIEPRKIKAMLNKAFSSMAGRSKVSTLPKPKTNKIFKVHSRDTKQNHLCLGFPSISYHDPRRYVISVLNNILGGTMSSHLFQEIREKRGLAYSIYSYYSFFENAGTFNVYAGTAEKNTLEVLQIVQEEIRKIKTGKITNAELTKARENLKGNLVLSTESSPSRMNWNTRSWLHYGRIISMEEMFKKVNAVTTQQVLSLAEEIFVEKNQSLAIIGQVDRKQRNAIGAIVGCK